MTVAYLQCNSETQRKQMMNKKAMYHHIIGDTAYHLQCFLLSSGLRVCPGDKNT